MPGRGGVSRREFLRLSGAGLGSMLVAAACRPQAEVLGVARPATPPLEEGPIVGDVLEFGLEGGWPGRFGFVRLRLHQAFVGGERAYFIRTDASEKAFARQNGLVFAPKLAAARHIEGATGQLYLFAASAAGQRPLLSASPADEAFTPLWHVHRVMVGREEVIDSLDALRSAESAGGVTVEPLDVLVNYPVVKWPGGELPVDEEKKEYLGGGQLLEPVDTEGLTATFKLHECFPGSRYIVTDTSAVPMAPMMQIAPSAATGRLAGEERDATDAIWVFANGIEGSGAMGFQPAIFGHRAGDPLWSPFWNHFTLKWGEDGQPGVLRSGDDVRAALEAGQMEQFNGTPDTHPMGFVVNCPVPVLAANTFEG